MWVIRIGCVLGGGFCIVFINDGLFDVEGLGDKMLLILNRSFMSEVWRGSFDIWFKIFLLGYVFRSLVVVFLSFVVCWLFLDFGLLGSGGCWRFGVLFLVFFWVLFRELIFLVRFLIRDLIWLRWFLVLLLMCCVIILGNFWLRYVDCCCLYVL